MAKTTVFVFAVALALVGVTAVSAAGGRFEHAIVGSIEKVDRGGKTLVVKTADGTDNQVD